MKKDPEIKVLLLQVIVYAIIIFAVIFSVTKLTKVSDRNNWNDGHCECGGDWVYEQAVGHYYSTTYLYHCDNCGKVIEVHERK